MAAKRERRQLLGGADSASNKLPPSRVLPAAEVSGALANSRWDRTFSWRVQLQAGIYYLARASFPSSPRFCSGAQSQLHKDTEDIFGENSL
jgi:hypothetical protein